MTVASTLKGISQYVPFSETSNWSVLNLLFFQQIETVPDCSRSRGFQQKWMTTNVFDYVVHCTKMVGIVEPNHTMQLLDCRSKALSMSGKSSAKIFPESRQSSSWHSDPSGPEQPQSALEQPEIGGNSSTSSFENSFLILSLFTRAETMNLCRNGRTNMFVTLQGTSNFKAFRNNLVVLLMCYD